MSRVCSIGFTGTIASGKTARCQHLVYTAVKRQLPELNLAKADVVKLVSVNHGVATLSSPSAPPLPSLPQERLLKDLAVPVRYLNADLVAHHIYRPGTRCYEALIEYFGPTILATTDSDASHARGQALSPIDRRALGARVFADRAELHALNAICWPHISHAIAETFARCCEAAHAAQKPALLFVLEAALLVDLLATPATREGTAVVGVAPALREIVTDVWMTRCEQSVAIERVAQRDGLPAEAAKARLAQQKSAEETSQILATLGFAGPHVQVFETTHMTLDEGLLDIEGALDAYWQRAIAPPTTTR